MNPRFPILPSVLFLISAFCLLPILQWAVAHAEQLWPLAAALAHILLFITVSAWCACAIHAWDNKKSLARFEANRHTHIHRA